MRRTTGKKALAYRGKGGQNTDIAFLKVRGGSPPAALNTLRIFFRGIFNLSGYFHFARLFFRSPAKTYKMGLS